jgi:hypothetical protein
VFEGALKESELQKLKRDSAFASWWEQTPVSSYRAKVVKRRTLQEEENRRLEISGKNCEVPWIVGSGRSSEGFNPRVQAEPLAIMYQHIGVRRVQELHARRNRESRFPDLIGAVNHRRDRWHEIPRTRDSTLRRFQSRKEHGGNARSRVAKGPTGVAWRTTRGIAHRPSGLWKVGSHDLSYDDFPTGKSPTRLSH